MGKTRTTRTAAVALTVALMATGAAACTSDATSSDTGKAGATAPGTAAPGTAAPAATTAASKAPEVFGAAGYRGLTPGMAKEAALATGALEAAPVSLLEGCTDFAYKGGPAPDAARMAAEAATDAKYKDLNAKADAAKQGSKPETLRPGASAKEAAEFAARQSAGAAGAAADAKLMADASMARVELLTAREAKEKAFLAAGRVSFGAAGLRELVGPAGARTAEGVGAGSAVADLQKAYAGKGIELARTGRYEVPAEGRPGWFYEFTVDGQQVSGVALVDHTTKCA
ncbi:hypothetical protein OH807_15855 [Kitasatospora sp. NBC_01560]|uniref:hypothetical protein n=1 Tax=Kitasatospora sp. NBC_01560 TaxID=2975965 RepID=UPI0038633F00